MRDRIQALFARIDSWLNRSSDLTKFVFAFTGMIVTSMVFDLVAALIRLLIGM